MCNKTKDIFSIFSSNKIKKRNRGGGMDVKWNGLCILSMIASQLRNAIGRKNCLRQKRGVSLQANVDNAWFLWELMNGRILMVVERKSGGTGRRGNRVQCVALSKPFLPGKSMKFSFVRPLRTLSLTLFLSRFFSRESVNDKWDRTRIVAYTTHVDRENRTPTKFLTSVKNQRFKYTGTLDNCPPSVFNKIIPHLPFYSYQKFYLVFIWIFYS